MRVADGFLLVKGLPRGGSFPRLAVCKGMLCRACAFGRPGGDARTWGAVMLHPPGRPHKARLLTGGHTVTLQPRPGVHACISSCEHAGGASRIQKVGVCGIPSEIIYSVNTQKLLTV